MTGENDKSQPQELLEEVIGITHGDTPEFPTIEEQQEHWRLKDDPLPFTCPTCLRKFKNAKAVAMHKARAHDMTILAPKQKKPVLNPDGTTLAQRREDYLQEAGRPVETLDTRRKKWSLARRRRYNAKKKAMEAGLPIGGEPIKWSPLPLPPQEEPVTLIRFCPHCGKGLERFLA